MTTQPLILVTNDDGIDSQGLWAAVEALLPLGEVLVIAPDRQWSGASRSMPPHVTGRRVQSMRQLAGRTLRAIALDATPALLVLHAVLELLPRKPDLLVSGINFGANLGLDVGISGTAGAALQAAALDIPALAISLEMAEEYHLSGNAGADCAVTALFARRFADRLLSGSLPGDVDVLNVNVPSDATSDTAWRLTRVSRRSYYVPAPRPERSAADGRIPYRPLEDFRHVEPGSDLWALGVDRVVSVSPLSLDITSRVAMDDLDRHLRLRPAADRGCANDSASPVT
jgi:5'-nucleotidase